MIIFSHQLQIIMYCTDLEETQWQVIKKILNLQDRKRKYEMIIRKHTTNHETGSIPKYAVVLYRRIGDLPDGDVLNKILQSFRERNPQQIVQNIIMSFPHDGNSPYLCRKLICISKKLYHGKEKEQQTSRRTY